MIGVSIDLETMPWAPASAALRACTRSENDVIARIATRFVLARIALQTLTPLNSSIDMSVSRRFGACLGSRQRSTASRPECVRQSTCGSGINSLMERDRNASTNSSFVQQSYGDDRTVRVIVRARTPDACIGGASRLRVLRNIHGCLSLDIAVHMVRPVVSEIAGTLRCPACGCHPQGYKQ